MSALPSESSTTGPAAETIAFETSTRAEAELLERKLAGFEPRLVRRDEGWLVEIAPDRRLTPLLLHIFRAVCEWLHESRRASVEVSFGQQRFTFLRPSDSRPSQSAEFLLRRVIQLQTALESRAVIEQAKGILAGRLRLAVGEAFEVLRHAARSSGRELHELAAEIVGAGELPAEVLHSYADRRLRRPR